MMAETADGVAINGAAVKSTFSIGAMGCPLSSCLATIIPLSVGERVLEARDDEVR